MIPESFIRPEIVAGKLAAAENLDPHLAEVLWFVQSYSFQPNGLHNLANDLIAGFPEHFQSKAMVAAGAPTRSGNYSLEQCLTAWKIEVRGLTYSTRFEDSSPVPLPSEVESLSFHDMLLWFIDEKTTSKDARGDDVQAIALRSGLARFNFPFLQKRCLTAAQSKLPQYLRDLCERPDIGIATGPRWAPGLVPALFAYMARHAERERERLAMTEVAKQVFDALDYAWAEKKLVRVNGDSRFGKTESLRAYCAGHPGRFRLVTVPCSNSEGDLVRAVAEVLGIPVSFGACGAELRGKVEFILRHGRLGIVADESHFLFPVRYARDTVPTRLNWLRTQIVDRGLPCALVSTPQAYEGQRKRFDRATGYNLEQWTGRMALTVNLPETLSREDLLAVARIHFPEVAQTLLEDAADAAIHATSYTKALQDIAARARWLASKRGPAAAVSQADLDAAIREVVPEAAAELLGDPVREKRAGKATATRLQPSRKPAAEVLRDLRPGGRREKNSVLEMPPRGRTAESVHAPDLVTA